MDCRTASEFRKTQDGVSDIWSGMLHFHLDQFKIRQGVVTVGLESESESESELGLTKVVHLWPECPVGTAVYDGSEQLHP